MLGAAVGLAVVGVAVGVAVGVIVAVVGLNVKVGALVRGRQTASVPGAPSSPSGQLQTPAPPPTGWMVRPPLQPEPPVEGHLGKAGTAQIFAPPCHVQHEISTIPTHGH